MIPPTKQLKEAVIQQKHLRELFALARVGNSQALSELRLNYQLKFYTQLEVRLVERLIEWRRKMRDDGLTSDPPIDVRDQELTIDLQPLYNSNEVVVAQINWLQQMEQSEFYLAGVTYLTGPGRGGCSEWMLKRSKLSGFKPLFCSLAFEPEPANGSQRGGD